MNVSEEIHNLIRTIKVLAKDDEYIKISRVTPSPEVKVTSFVNDIIDVAEIDFSDDETWLYKSEHPPTVLNLATWLYEDSEDLKDLYFHATHLTLMRQLTKLESTKKIDSRTFTRPKKRFNRPSLDFNDGRFKVLETIHNSGSDKDAEDFDNTTENERNLGVPLKFDLSEPANIFNNGKGDSDVDSFQNMSPPSLVSSSMFSSIMENSYIKNDPVLREIRDADYTEAILQGYGPSLLNSFSGSCSSVDSDTPEGFLKRSVESTFVRHENSVSNDSTPSLLNGTFITNNTVLLNETFQKDSCGRKSRSCTRPEKSNNISSNNKSSIFNNTYRKNSIEDLNNTFCISTHNENKNRINEDANRTIIINNDQNNMDSNRLNYTKNSSCIIEDSKCDKKYNTFLKRNRCSLGSSDSLDCASSLSNSSSGKGSSKMLNMAEVDAIVLQQEQSLQQVMSTPKTAVSYPTNLHDYANISPIRHLVQPDHSDSEGSSNDEYVTVGSGSSKSITSGNSDSVLVVIPKNLNNMHNQVPKAAITKNAEVSKNQANINRHTLYGSYSNLHKAKLMAQQVSQKSTAVTTNGPKSHPHSNLRSMDSNLKSSYTQLKPVFTNLPSAVTTNTKITSNNINKAKVSEAPMKIAESMPSMLRDHPKIAPNVKVAAKPSGLPRPISAIPRPAGSKIPGPQSRTGIPQSRPPTSKINVNTDF